MAHDFALTAALLDEHTWLNAEEFCRACGVEPQFVELLVREELLAMRPLPAPQFSAGQIGRVQRIERLQRDFDASLPAVAVMLDLLEEIDRLRAALRRAGLEQ